MREQGTYSKAMEISISLAAGSYMAYLKARDEVSKLDKVCMTRISRENNEYKVVNPEFSVMQDAAEQTRKALRELRLTRATIEADDENDEVDELIKKSKMLEKNDLIQLKARTLERLQEVNVEDYTLDQTDIRLKDYVKSAISHPDDHNLYELLSILRFFRLLDAYIFKPTEVKKFIVFYENLKFSGLKGRVKYRLTPIQVFQFANILGFYRTPEKGFAGTPIIRTT